MSETVHYKGTLTEVERLEGENLESQCKRLLGGTKLDSFYDSYKEMLGQELYKQYIIHDDIIYSLETESIDPDLDIFKIKKNENGNYEFEVRYYNGGCGFGEAIEEAFDTLNKKD